jgi:hypothetical protein
MSIESAMKNRETVLTIFITQFCRKVWRIEQAWISIILSQRGHDFNPSGGNGAQNGEILPLRADAVRKREGFHGVSMEQRVATV